MKEREKTKKYLRELLKEDPEFRKEVIELLKGELNKKDR